MDSSIPSMQFCPLSWVDCAQVVAPSGMRIIAETDFVASEGRFVSGFSCVETGERDETTEKRCVPVFCE